MRTCVPFCWQMCCCLRGSAHVAASTADGSRNQPVLECCRVSVWQMGYLFSPSADVVMCDLLVAPPAATAPHAGAKLSGLWQGIRMPILLVCAAGQTVSALLGVPHTRKRKREAQEEEQAERDRRAGAPPFPPEHYVLSLQEQHNLGYQVRCWQ